MLGTFAAASDVDKLARAMRANVYIEELLRENQLAASMRDAAGSVGRPPSWQATRKK